jgi:hypothetical protein
LSSLLPLPVLAVILPLSAVEGKESLYFAVAVRFAALACLLSFRSPAKETLRRRFNIDFRDVWHSRK